MNVTGTLKWITCCDGINKGFQKSALIKKREHIVDKVNFFY